jgi:hypothetical protein
MFHQFRTIVEMYSLCHMSPHEQDSKLSQALVMYFPVPFRSTQSFEMHPTLFHIFVHDFYVFCCGYKSRPILTNRFNDMKLHNILFA